MKNIDKQNKLTVQIIAIAVAVKSVVRQWQKCCDCQVHVNSACLPAKLMARSSFQKADSSMSLGPMTDCFTVKHLSTKDHRQNTLLLHLARIMPTEH